MFIFSWIAASIVIVTLIYVSFVLTLADWFTALRKGQAVTLLPERGGHKWPLWTQVLVIVIGMALCIPLFIQPSIYPRRDRFAFVSSWTDLCTLGAAHTRQVLGVEHKYKRKII
jgi:hypothetical protein